VAGIGGQGLLQRVLQAAVDLQFHKQVWAIRPHDHTESFLLKPPCSLHCSTSPRRHQRRLLTTLLPWGGGIISAIEGGVLLIH